MTLTVIAATVFLAIFLVILAVSLYVTRSPNRLENRLREVREDGLPGAHGRAHQSDSQSHRSADGLLILDTQNLTDTRVRLTRAGCCGRHSVFWYQLTRFVLAGALGTLGLQAQRVLEAGGAAGLFLIAGSAIFGFAIPALWVGGRVSKRRDAIRRAIPNVLDLIIVCVEAGLSLNAAIQRIAAEMKTTYRELAEELNILNQEIFIGKSRAEAFRNLARRTGLEELRSLATVLMQSDRMGTSIAEVLRVQAETMRTKRRQVALEAAHKMPVKLVFPLVLFIFPEILVVLLGPAGLHLFHSLSQAAG